MPLLETLWTTVKELTPTHWISLLALVVSCISLAVSFANFWRDRPRVKVTSVRYRSEQEPGSIGVTVVNVGRRPVYLVRLCGTAGWRRDTISWQFVHEGQGIKLGENESKRFYLSNLPRGADEHDVVGFDHDAEDIMEFDRMWVVDSRGKVFTIPKIKKHLREMRKDYRGWCDRTGYWRNDAQVTPAEAAPVPPGGPPVNPA